MNLYNLTFIFFISCHPVGTKEQSKIMLPDTIDSARSLTNADNIVVPHTYENDTTTINLAKFGVNLLDVRIDSTGRRELLIQRGKIITDKIEIPTQEIIQGFAVNWIKATEKGFEISIEYGGSSRYYQKDFRFYFDDENFVLKEILVDTFDKRNPEDEKSYTKNTDTLDVPIKVKDFKIVDYLK